MLGWSRPVSLLSTARRSEDTRWRARNFKSIRSRTMKPILPIFAVVALTFSVADAQSQVKKSTIPGVTNFAQVETTVACAGATTPGSVPGIKKMGFASIINLRLASEAGAD